MQYHSKIALKVCVESESENMEKGLRGSGDRTLGVPLGGTRRVGGTWDFSGGPVVKSSPSNAEGAGMIPGWRAKIPHASVVKKT